MKPYCMYEKSLLHLLLLNAEVQKRQRDLKHLRSSNRYVYQLCSSSIQIFQLPSDWPCNALRLCIHLLISTQSTDLLHITPLIANLCQFHHLIPDFQPGIYFISLFVTLESATAIWDVISWQLPCWWSAWQLPDLLTKPMLHLSQLPGRKAATFTTVDIQPCTTQPVQRCRTPLHVMSQMNHTLTNAAQDSGDQSLWDSRCISMLKAILSGFQSQFKQSSLTTQLMTVNAKLN